MILKSLFLKRWGLAALGVPALLIAPLVCSAQGFITTVAGNGAPAYFGENVEATAAGLGGPNGVAVDSAGNLYIADNGSRIRKVDTDGIIRTVAGSNQVTPNLGFSGDGGPATSAAMLGTGVHQGVAVDSAGNIYFADILNHRVRKVDTAGIITTVAGSGAVIGSGGSATTTALFNPHAVAVDSAGNLYIADTSNSRIRKVDAAGNISTVAGTGTIGFSGDGGAATSAQINQPRSVTVDRAGNVYFSDFGNIRVRKVDTAGIITTLAGIGTPGFSGDGGPGTSAALQSPLGVAVDDAGNLYIADSGNNRIRKVDPAGIITTVAGTDRSGRFADGVPATSTTLFSPRDVAVDAAGNIYLADFGNNRVRKISATPPSVSVTGNFTSLAFTATAGGAAPPQQLVNLGSSGAALGITTAVSTSSGGGWLTATPGNGTTPVVLNVSVNPAGLAAGAYDGVVMVNPTEAQNVALAIAVTLTVSPAAPPAGAPALSAGGVVNGASFAAAPSPVTSGGIVAIFGSNLAAETLQASSVPLPTTLGGTQVLVNGQPAPLFFVSAGQINAQIPWEVRGNTINVRVATNGAPSNTVVTSLAGASPGIFLVQGADAAIVTHGADGSLVTAANPAARGEVLVLYCTGLGAVTNTPPSGAAGPSGPLAETRSQIILSVGFQPATIYFSGLAPGFVGLYQINWQVPENAPLGDAVALQLITGGQLGNTTTMAIR